MALKGRFHAGTTVRREFDLPRFREAVKDFRHWISYAIVATVTDQGEIDDTDPAAVLVTPGGVMVDVVLLPAEEPLTCRYGGVAGGPSVTIYHPIHPGDEVVVARPDGESGLPGVILAVLSSKAAPLPTEDDGKPVFRNDRLSVFAHVPIEVRTPGGSVRVEVDGTVTANSPHVNLGDAQVTEQLVHGTTYRGQEATMHAADVAALAAVAAPFAAWLAGEGAPGLGPFALTYPETAALLTAMAGAAAAIEAAIQAFEGQSALYLSTVSKTR